MRIVCIDDEHLVLQYIERQLKKIDHIDVVGTFTNPLEGKQFILSNDVDAVFLDIEMTPLNGVELAERLLEEKPELQIIFTTAYESFAVQAFELNAIDYLVKPVRLERLQVTVKRIQKRLEAVKKDVAISPDFLRIKVASYLCFEVEPDKFESLQWRTSKAQELFVYLLQNNSVIVEKSVIIDLLWSEYEVDKAYSLLYTTIYNIRKQLKDFSDHIVLHNHSYGYLLELRNVKVDLFSWEQKLMKLPRIALENAEDYEKVMKRYTGDYLSNYDFTWLEAERERLKNLWIRTAKSIAAFYIKDGRMSEAIRWYNEITERYPTIEEAHFKLMKLYEANGDFTLMMQQYSTLHKISRDYFDAKPDQAIIDWYVEKLS